MTKKSAKTVSKKVKLSLGKEIMSFAIVGLLLLPGVMSVPAAEAREPICTASVMCALQSLGFESSLTNEGDLRDDIQLIRAKLNQLFALLNALNAIVQERNGVASGVGLYANIKANATDGPIQVTSGSDVNLTWSSVGTVSCEGTSNKAESREWGEALAGSGFQTVTGITKSTVFKIKCASANGSASIVDTVVVNVTGQQQENPEVIEVSTDLEADPESVESSEDVTLSWSADKADTCAASSLPANSDWTGTVATSGTKVIAELATTTAFSLSCENDTDVHSDSVTVSVGSQLPTPGEDDDPPIVPQPAPLSMRIIAPNGGETWPVGSVQEITWDSANASAPNQPVRIVLIDPSAEGTSGEDRLMIERNVPNTGSYTWTVGNYRDGQITGGARYKIKVCVVASSDNDAVCDKSDARFTIPVASITQADQASLMATAGSIQSILDGLNALLRLRY